METMALSSFKRSSVVKNKYKFTNNSIIALEELYIYIPAIYESKNLAVIDDTCNVFGVLCIADINNNYVSMTVPTICNITPESITEVDIDDTLYYKLVIPKGMSLINELGVVVQLDMAYLTFDLFFRKGKVPFFITDMDLLEIFQKLGKYADTKVDPYLPVIKILIGIICRSSNDLKIPYRLTVKTKADIKNKKMQWISINNIFYAYTTTMSKIGSSYMSQGMLDMLGSDKSDVPKRTDLEALLMK